MVECIGGYFQFSVKADGLYFTVYPPKSGEQPATVADALYYLDKKKIMDCDTVKMKECFFKSERSTVYGKGFRCRSVGEPGVRHIYHEFGFNGDGSCILSAV